jgi:hypothetical protein
VLMPSFRCPVFAQQTCRTSIQHCGSCHDSEILIPRYLLSCRCAHPFLAASPAYQRTHCHQLPEGKSVEGRRRVTSRLCGVILS